MSTRRLKLNGRMPNNSVPPAHGTDNEPLMIPDEAIEFLRLGDRPNPKRALYRLCREGRLAYVDLARGIRRFRPADLRAFVDASIATKRDVV